jgi:predicted esterase
MKQTESHSKLPGRLLGVLLAVLSPIPAPASQLVPRPREGRVPVAVELAAIPDLDRRLADLERTLNAVSDQKSLTATTARFILEIIKEAKENPQAFDPKAANAPARPRQTGPDTGAPEARSQKHADYIASFGITMDFASELKRASALAADLKVGRDPVAGLKGDVHLAYRSDLDGMLQPYRIYVPSTYDKNKKYPLVMFLHGANCDEDTFMNAEILQPAAEDRGYIIASINGRGPFSSYRRDNGAEKDLFDVMALMQKYYNIDSDHIFLTGHSMGGMGTWRVGLDFRDRFAALAPMAGTRDMPDLEAKLASGRKIPILITTGGKDKGVPPAPAFEVYQKLKKAGFPTKAVEYPDDEHEDVFYSSLPEVFAWFDQYRK